VVVLQVLALFCLGARRSSELPRLCHDSSRSHRHFEKERGYDQRMFGEDLWLLRGVWRKA
jgi:hypothetical protein